MLISGCAMPFTKIVIPPVDLPSDTTLGYHTEQDRHDIRLVLGVPKQMENWTASAFPFGSIRRSEWDNGGFLFWSRVWFPMGLPKEKGDHCGLQVYEGIKVEGGKLKEIESKGLLPVEFFAAEQNSVRIKCDLDAVPSKYNEAGY